uniref:Peptidase A1 domain-containing protein n=1 Tax=Bursaphelenchus xylophilus TaxID=6326 RepID=A0A1I7RYS4_BURXY
MKSICLSLLLAAAVISVEIPIQRRVVASTLSSGIPIDVDTASKAYVGVISLGSPGQDFNVAFDLNTPALWVPDSACSCGDPCKNEKLCPQLCAAHCCTKSFLGDEKSGSCTNKNVFDTQKSRSYVGGNANVDLKFLGGTVKAATGYDTLRLGPHYRPGLTANNIQFGRVKDFNQDYELVNYDGVFGLGFGEVNGISSPIKQLASHGVIPSALLTAYIYNEGHQNTVDGVLTIGQVDRRRCENAKVFAETVRTADAWVFSSPSFNLTTTYGTTNGSWMGVLDFSTDYIQVPQTALKLIQNYLSGSIDEDGRIIFQCVRSFPLYFNIGGQPLILNTKLFSERYAGTLCRLKIRATAPSDKYAFRYGWPILQNYCVVLDFNGRLAFTLKRVKFTE